MKGAVVRKLSMVCLLLWMVGNQLMMYIKKNIDLTAKECGNPLEKGELLAKRVLAFLFSSFFIALLIQSVGMTQTQQKTFFPSIRGQISVFGEALSGHKVWLVKAIPDPTPDILEYLDSEDHSYDSFKPEVFFGEALILEAITDKHGSFAFNQLTYNSYWLITLAPDKSLNPFFIRLVTLREMLEEGIVENRFDFVYKRVGQLKNKQSNSPYTRERKSLILKQKAVKPKMKLLCSTLHLPS